jgi:hypothetical protein
MRAALPYGRVNAQGVAMRTSTIMAAAGLAMLTGGPAQAANPKLETTADLVAFCDTVGPVGEVRDGQNFCDGFIAGSGLLYLELVRAGQIKRLACAEPIPTLEQARMAFVSWAEAHPEAMAEKPIDGLWRAMAATYPCAK